MSELRLFGLDARLVLDLGDGGELDVTDAIDLPQARVDLLKISRRINEHRQATPPPPPAPPAPQPGKGLHIDVPPLRPAPQHDTPANWPPWLGGPGPSPNQIPR